MYLSDPKPRYIESYIEFCIAYKKNSLADLFLNSLSVEELENQPVNVLALRLLAELRENAHTNSRVSSSQFWLVDDNEIVGVGNIRHYLIPALEFFGGHIGYGIRMGEWGKGLGTVLLTRLLSQARGFGIRTALLTCDVTNTPSRRVIEKNGGELLDTIVTDAGRRGYRYLIDSGVIPTPFPLKNHALLYQLESDGEIALVPHKAVDEGGQIISYYFNILHGDENVGWLVFRAADEARLYYDGNIGYFIKKDCRGRGYAGSACRLLGAKLNRLGLTQAVITCDPGNVPSRRVCQKLEAVFLELAMQKPASGKQSERIKCRYLWKPTS